MLIGRRKPAPPGEGLVVGPQDAVQGTVAAQTVTVDGRMDGTLDVVDALAIRPTGRVGGTIQAARLVIEAGATVRATCRVGLPAGESGPVLPEPPRDERAAVLRLTPRSAERVR